MSFMLPEVSDLTIGGPVCSGGVSLHVSESFNPHSSQGFAPRVVSVLPMKTHSIIRKATRLLSTVLLCTSAYADLRNVAPDGVAYTSGPLYNGMNIQSLIDNDRDTILHADAAPAAPFFYSVDLGRDVTVQSIKIFPRQDGCCPERLRNFRISINQDDNGAAGTEVWGADLLTGATENAGSVLGSVVAIQVPVGQTGRWIKILSLQDPVPSYSLQISDMEVYEEVPPDQINRALNAAVTVNGPLFGGGNPGNLVDGKHHTLIHGDVAPAAGFAYTLNLGTLASLNRIRIWARQDGCCPDRLSNYRVTLHPDDSGAPGAATWTADLHTDASNPGSAIGSFDELLASADPGAPFEGQYLRIESLDAVVPDYALQISEVEAFGTLLGGANILISSQPKDAAVGAGQSATFSVGVSVVNGDASKAAFQWERNGVKIDGAKGATLSTPPILLADDKAKYRCVVSYPGIPDLVSDDAILRVDLAYHAQAYSNRPLWSTGWSISQLVNGDRSDTIHGDQTIEPGFSYQIDLGSAVKLEELDLFPRQDGCCPERLKNIRVSLHSDNGGQIGDPVWSADLYTDGSNAGSGAGKIVRVMADLDAVGKFEGQWIQILNIEDSVTPYALQMTEVEVYGTFAGGVPILSYVEQPKDASSVPGRVARFGVVAKVVNGDPPKITYQWTRDGVVIPGANTNSYTTPPLTEADTTVPYRCVISYPGLADLPSEAAHFTFDGNYAKGQPAFSNRPLWGPGGWNISQIVDGDRSVAVHGDATIDAGFAYTVDLGLDVAVDHIDIYPRQNVCCPERLANIHVSLHADGGGTIGDEIWGADLLTDGSNAGSGPGTVVNVHAEDGAGPFHGNWIRISALDDPVKSYFLQVAEVEVFGAAVVRPQLVFERKLQLLELRWTVGVLETAATLGGAWSPVVGAKSPYQAALDQPGRYFRLSQ